MLPIWALEGCLTPVGGFMGEPVQLANAQHQLKKRAMFEYDVIYCILVRETYMFDFQVASAPALTEERICSRTIPMLLNPRDVGVGITSKERVICILIIPSVTASTDPSVL